MGRPTSRLAGYAPPLPASNRARDIHLPSRNQIHGNSVAPWGAVVWWAIFRAVAIVRFPEVEWGCGYGVRVLCGEAGRGVREHSRTPASPGESNPIAWPPTITTAAAALTSPFIPSRMA